MRLEASPFHNPVSACKASDAGIIGTYTAIDPAGVVHHRVGKANLGAGVYKYNYSVIRSFLLQEARAFPSQRTIAVGTTPSAHICDRV